MRPPQHVLGRFLVEAIELRDSVFALRRSMSQIAYRIRSLKLTAVAEAARYTPIQNIRFNRFDEITEGSITLLVEDIQRFTR